MSMFCFGGQRLESKIEKPKLRIILCYFRIIVKTNYENEIQKTHDKNENQ